MPPFRTYSTRTRRAGPVPCSPTSAAPIPPRNVPRPCRRPLRPCTRRRAVALARNMPMEWVRRLGGRWAGSGRVEAAEEGGAAAKVVCRTATIRHGRYLLDIRCRRRLASIRSSNGSHPPVHMANIQNRRLPLALPLRPREARGRISTMADHSRLQPCATTPTDRSPSHPLPDHRRITPRPATTPKTRQTPLGTPNTSRIRTRPAPRLRGGSFRRDNRRTGQEPLPATRRNQNLTTIR